MKSVLPGWLRQQVTRLGLMFGVTALMVGLAAFASANNLLFLLLAAMLSALLVSGFFSRLSLAGLEMDFRLPDRISARRQVMGRILLRNAKRWMPSFSIHISGSAGGGFGTTLYFPAIPGGATVEAAVRASFAHRGAYRDNSFQFRTRFPFGFSERTQQVTLRRDVLVYPALDPQPGFEELLASIAGEIESHYRGRGHDFYRIRPYEPLESARHVDWKATAHTGELQVREFAREQEHLVEIYLDLDLPPESAAWFEHAVECCAFLCWNLSRREARIRFRTQDFDLRLPEEGDVYVILKYLALTSPLPGRSASPPLETNSFQVAFTASPQRLAGLGWAEARLIGPQQ